MPKYKVSAPFRWGDRYIAASAKAPVIWDLDETVKPATGWVLVTDDVATESDSPKTGQMPPPMTMREAAKGQFEVKPSKSK